MLPNPVGAVVALGIASVVAGGVKGFYDSKNGGTNFSVVEYSAAVQGVAGGFFGFIASYMLSSGIFMAASKKPSITSKVVCSGAGAVVGGVAGGLETTVGYVFGYGLGKLL